MAITQNPRISSVVCVGPSNPWAARFSQERLGEGPHSRKPISCSIARSMPSSSRDIARASCRRKACVSKDHLPPTSLARTTSLALPCAPESSGCTRSFLLPTTTTVRGAVPSQRRNQCGVHCDLCSVAERKTVCDNLQPTSICVWSGNRSKSLTSTFVDTRAPVSRLTRAAALSRADMTHTHPQMPPNDDTTSSLALFDGDVLLDEDEDEAFDNAELDESPRTTTLPVKRTRVDEATENPAHFVPPPSSPTSRTIEPIITLSGWRKTTPLPRLDIHVPKALQLNSFAITLCCRHTCLAQSFPIRRDNLTFCERVAKAIRKQKQGTTGSIEVCTKFSTRRGKVVMA